MLLASPHLVPGRSLCHWFWSAKWSWLVGCNQLYPRFIKEGRNREKNTFAWKQSVSTHVIIRIMYSLSAIRAKPFCHIDWVNVHYPLLHWFLSHLDLQRHEMVACSIWSALHEQWRPLGSAAGSCSQTEHEPRSFCHPAWPPSAYLYK